MRRWCQVILIFAVVVFFPNVTNAQPQNELYQVSVINALLQGVYEGETTIQELKQHGDFGIGTFDTLDGEMVGLDGAFYQVKHTGEVLPVDKQAKTPFAAVVHFRPEQTAELGEVQDYDQLQKLLDKMISNQNYFYAIRVDGLFSYVKTRSVPPQSKPYRPLAEVTKTQPVFEFEQVRGTVLGFWCPQYVNGINVPGYHLHFISDDRTKGGHLLAMKLQSGRVQISGINNFQMRLPGLADFQKAALNQDYHEDLKAAEQ